MEATLAHDPSFIMRGMKIETILGTRHLIEEVYIDLQHGTPLIIVSMEDIDKKEKISLDLTTFLSIYGKQIKDE